MSINNNLKTIREKLSEITLHVQGERDLILFHSVIELIDGLESELQKTLKDLRRAAKYIERETGRDDCGRKVCLAQIRLVKEILGNGMFSEDTEG